MGKFKMKKLIVGMFFCMFCVLLDFPVYAVTGEGEQAVTIKKLSQWDNGVNITEEKVEGSDDNLFTINADTLGNEKGYYAAYLYQNKAQNIGKYDAVAYYVNNTGSLPLQMNFSVTVNKNTSLELKDSSRIMLENMEGTEGELQTVSYGTFQIPTGFNGIVYIPFRELKNDKDETISINKINSFGVTLVMEEEQQQQFELGNFRFLSGSLDQVKNEYYEINILGTNQIVLSDTGTVMKNYQATVKNLDGEAVSKNVYFSLAEETEGVTLSTDGKLEIASTCKADQITISAKAEDSINAQKLTIELLRNEGGAATAGSVGIPDSSKVPSVMPHSFRLLLAHITLIKAAIFFVSLVVAAIIFSWLSIVYKEYKNMVKLMNETHEQQQSEEEQ